MILRRDRLRYQDEATIETMLDRGYRLVGLAGGERAIFVIDSKASLEDRKKDAARMLVEVSGAEPTVGDVLYGFCGGRFGRDSYGKKVVEGVGEDWLVVREEDGIPNMATFSSRREMMKEFSEWSRSWEEWFGEDD